MTPPKTDFKCMYLIDSILYNKILRLDTSDRKAYHSRPTYSGSNINENKINISSYNDHQPTANSLSPANTTSVVNDLFSQSRNIMTPAVQPQTQPTTNNLIRDTSKQTTYPRNNETQTANISASDAATQINPSQRDMSNQFHYSNRDATTQINQRDFVKHYPTRSIDTQSSQEGLTLRYPTHEMEAQTIQKDLVSHLQTGDKSTQNIQQDTTAYNPSRNAVEQSLHTSSQDTKPNSSVLPTQRKPVTHRRHSVISMYKGKKPVKRKKMKNMRQHDECPDCYQPNQKKHIDDAVVGMIKDYASPTAEPSSSKVIVQNVPPSTSGMIKHRRNDINTKHKWLKAYKAPPNQPTPVSLNKNSKNDFRTHKNKNNKIQCTICDSTFASKYSLKRHMNNIHEAFTDGQLKGAKRSSEEEPEGVYKKRLRTNMKKIEYEKYL